jgi:hypothetical protein
MRMRNDNLRTGSLLTCFEQDRLKNRSLLFLVVGATDIDPLREIETACRQHLAAAGLEGFEWNAVPDQGQLAAVDPHLDVARIFRLEVAELTGVDPGELRALLGPALDRLASGQVELFPSAGGAVGGPAEGIQLLGRGREIAALSDLVRQGRSTLLLAPRRSGKTSVLRALERNLAGEYRTVYADLERDFTPADVAARFWALASGERFRLSQQRAEEDWQGLLEEALSRLAAESERSLLLLLDELVFFLQHLTEGRRDEERHRESVLAFLDVLSGACFEVKAQLIFAGSLDLFDYLREVVRIEQNEVPPLLENLYSFPLPPLSLDAPKTEMRRVLLGTGLVPQEGDLDWLVENADLATPYAALRLLDYLASRVRAEGQATRGQLDSWLEEFLSQTEVFRDFDEQLRRKGTEVPGARRAINEALDQIAAGSEDLGVPENPIRTLFDRQTSGQGERLFSWFLETFPVRREEGRLLLASRLFRRWWQRQLLGAEQGR